MTVDALWVIGSTLTLIAAIFGIFRWYANQYESSNEERFDILTKHFDDTISTLRKAQQVDSDKTEELRKSIEKLKEEVYKDFVRRPEHDSLKASIGGIYDKLNNMAQSLNILIGQHNAEKSK